MTINSKESVLSKNNSSSESLQVNLFLLFLVMISAVITKLLRKASQPFSAWIVGMVFYEPHVISTLKKKMDEAKQHLSEFNPQDEFAEYSRAQRVRIKWETKLREVERPYKSNLFLYTSIARTVSVILIQLLRVSVIVSFRKQPVLHLPLHSLWPLTPVLSFPTGIPGAVSVPCWSIMCALALETCLP